MLTACRDLWWLTKSCRTITLLLFVGALIQQVIRLTIPVILGHMIDVLAMKDPENLRAQGYMLTILLVCAMSSVYLVQFFVRKWIIKMIHSVKGNVICDAFDHVLSLPVGFHQSRNTGDKTKVIHNGADKTISLAEAWAEEGLPIILHYVLSSSVLFYFWPLAGTAVGVGMPIVVACSVLFYRLGRKYREERHDSYEASESLLMESLQNVAVIQSFRMEESHSKQLRSIWERIYETGFKELRSANAGYIIRNAAILCTITSVMYFGFDLVAEGTMTSGIFILVLLITMRLMESLWPLGALIDETMYNGPALRRLRELFSIKSDVQESPVALFLPEPRGEILFDNVTFRYPGKTNDALNNFSLLIRSNSTTALVGPSGGGKSTVLNLLSRLWDPSIGRVLLDGYDVRDLKLSFRGHIAVVSQEINVLSGTIAYNIAFGRSDMSREEIERIARIAHMDEFVQQLPDGYDTLVGERGLRLSGGQRQRLAIARALAADCPIIVFDEATSHLDMESEAAIQEAMSALRGSRTIIMVAHRLSTISHADEIVVLEQGRVVEQGSHEDLRVLTDGVYRRYLRLQAQ